MLLPLRKIQIVTAMKQTYENLFALVKGGTSITFNPEVLSFNSVRKIVREAASHHGCIVTLHNTEAFSTDNWMLLAEEANGHMTIVFN